MKAVRAEEMRRLDEMAIEQVQIPGLILMENAGRGAFAILKQYLDDRRAKRVLVLCGPGNNGGDGYVIARHLYNSGFEVSIGATRALDELSGDARVNAGVAHSMQLPTVLLEEESEVEGLLADYGPFDAIVDALLGTGVSSDLQGVYLELVRYANRLDAFRFAVDIPTGVHADNGRTLGDAFRADATATFGAPKTGLYLFPGANNAGRIHIVEISIPRFVLDTADGVDLLGGPDDVPPIPPRECNTHKGRMGHLLVIAGSSGKGGAALLSAKAALKTGVGMVSVATHQELATQIEGLIPDVMMEGFDAETPDLLFLERVVEGKTAVAIGPGLGATAGTRRIVSWFLTESDLPLLLDADAISVLPSLQALVQKREAPVLLTPHPGEMGRLLESSASQVNQNRLGVAAEVARELGVHLVLKGAHSIVAAPEGCLAINLSGSPCLAKAGSGDVLTGMLGALLAMGMSPEGATRTGTWLHGRAGELAGARHGIHSTSASDLIDCIGETLRGFTC